MINALQHAYLDAMGVPLWLPRDAVSPQAEVTPARTAPAGAPQAPAGVTPPRASQTPALSPASSVRAGPGNSELLLLCSAVHEPAQRMATDIARAMRCEPVWAWPEPAADAPELSALIADRLFTTVLVFGQQAGQALAGDQQSATLGSARILIAPSLTRLQKDPAARKALWQLLCTERLAGRRQATGPD